MNASPPVPVPSPGLSPGPGLSPSGRVLVIGYGNPLRGDDGAGWHAVTHLAGDPRLAGADVLASHQLTPELAEDLARAHLAVLIDACRTGIPGTVSVRRVEPDHRMAPTWSHHLDPAALVDLTATLYGAPPPVFLVTVTGIFFGYRDRLSPAVRRTLPQIADTIDSLQARQVPGRENSTRNMRPKPMEQMIWPCSSDGRLFDDHQ